VTNEAPFEASQRTALATSSGSPACPIGVSVGRFAATPIYTSPKDPDCFTRSFCLLIQGQPLPPVHILRDWIYSIPTWLTGSIIVFGAVAISLLALACFHRFVPTELRRAHNDVAGFILAIVGVIYAVLLAFIAVSTWEDFNKAQDSADLEADMVDNLYVDSAGLPPALAFFIQQRLREYSRIVIDKEWPAQRAGRLNLEGWKPLYQLNTAISKFRSSEGTAAALDAEVLHTANDLYRARRDRLVASASKIPDIMWVITVLGGALTVGFSFLFGVPDFRLQLLMTGLLAASLALVIVLIVAFDCPFRGDLSVSSDVYSRLFERVAPEMQIDLAEVRNSMPEYRELSDSVLADKIYATYFSDLQRSSFDRLLVSQSH
jgi:Protein of unknown function (DUF4239)